LIKLFDVGDWRQRALLLSAQDSEQHGAHDDDGQHGQPYPPVPYQCSFPIVPPSIMAPCAIAASMGSNMAVMMRTAVDKRELVIVSIKRVSYVAELDANSPVDWPAE
jgi:hypothetical protein